MGTLTFYFDRCLGKRLPESIEKAKPPFAVEFHQRRKFRQDMPDDEWLAIAGKSGWIVVSHDKKFHDLSVELAAITQHGVGCFYLWGAQMPIWNKLICFTRGYDRIEQLARNTPRPFIYQIGYNCRIRRIDIP